MKFIAPVLLVAEAIYLSFVPALTIAHSIILLSLAGLFAFNQFLLSKQTPSLTTELGKLKSELEKQIEKQKESHDLRLKGVEDELSKMSMTSLKSSSASSKADNKPKYIF